MLTTDEITTKAKKKLGTVFLQVKAPHVLAGLRRIFTARQTVSLDGCTASKQERCPSRAVMSSLYTAQNGMGLGNFIISCVVLFHLTSIPKSGSLLPHHVLKL